MVAKRLLLPHHASPCVEEKLLSSEASSTRRDGGASWRGAARPWSHAIGLASLAFPHSVSRQKAPLFLYLHSCTPLSMSLRPMVHCMPSTLLALHLVSLPPESASRIGYTQSFALVLLPCMATIIVMSEYQGSCLPSLLRHPITIESAASL